MRWCQFAHIREGCNIGKTQSCNLWQQDFAQRGRNMSRILFAYCHFRHRVLRGRGGGPETGREIEQRSKKSGGKYWPKIALPSFFLSLSLWVSLSLCVCALDRSLLMLSFSSDGTDGRTDADGRTDGRERGRFLPPEILRERSCRAEESVRHAHRPLPTA